MSTGEPDIRDLVRALNGFLGPTLVAALSASRDRRISIAWAEPDGPVPPSEALERLQCAHDQFRLIDGAEGGDVARLWFIGMNPRLGDASPAEAIREGRFADVAAAAREMAEGGGFS